MLYRITYHFLDLPNTVKELVETFRCLDNRSLPLSLRCDFKADCLHGDDEENCPGEINTFIYSQ